MISQLFSFWILFGYGHVTIRYIYRLDSLASQRDNYMPRRILLNSITALELESRPVNARMNVIWREHPQVAWIRTIFEHSLGRKADRGSALDPVSHRQYHDFSPIFCRPEIRSFFLFLFLLYFAIKIWRNNFLLDSERAILFYLWCLFYEGGHL